MAFLIIWVHLTVVIRGILTRMIQRMVGYQNEQLIQKWLQLVQVNEKLHTKRGMLEELMICKQCSQQPTRLIMILIIGI